MATQTKKFQNRIISEATARNELDSLVWFVEMKIRLQHAAAPWPGARVPVIPVAPDAEISRHWIDILTVLLQDGNQGTGLEFAPALTDWSTLASTGVDWYEWSDWADADLICPACAAINDDCTCAGVLTLAKLELAMEMPA